jgi:putative ABC transport system ATP-binding protein
MKNIVNIQLMRVGKSFGSKRLFYVDNLNLISGDLIAISGVSGSGKSTFLYCLGLVEKFSEGKIFFDNIDVTSLSESKKLKLYKHDIGFLFQNYGLIDDITVSKNLDIVVNNRKDSGNKLELKVNALKKVGLENKLNTLVYTLSGGEQQRVAAAMLIIKQPRLILCDEPSAALDRANAQIVMDVLRDFSEQGSLVLVASHDQFIIDLCKSAYILENQTLTKLK